MILPTFGPRAIGSINHQRAVAWVAELSASGRAPATIVQAAQIASKALRAAVSAKLIAANPFDDVDLPRIERKEIRFLTPAQVGTLADAIDPRYWALVLVGAWCGLRAGITKQTTQGSGTFTMSHSESPELSSPKPRQIQNRLKPEEIDNWWQRVELEQPSNS